jgi:hypothetical protein
LCYIYSITALKLKVNMTNLICAMLLASASFPEIPMHEKASVFISPTEYDLYGDCPSEFHPRKESCLDSQIAIIEAEIEILRLDANKEQRACIDEVQNRLNLIRELMQD